MTLPPVIVGAGLAGLATALHLAPEPCIVLCAGRLGSGAASGWAQGGIAAALGTGDSPRQHAQDTLAAGVGLCDPAVVAAITEQAPGAIAWLTGLGVRFDRTAEGGYDLGLEGAHGEHRIVHAGGDGSGAEVMRALVAAVRRTPSISVLEHTRAERLVLGPDGLVRGVELGFEGEAGDGEASARERVRIDTDRVVLATGGTGGLWARTTNPLTAVGAGLALAARAGAVLRDLEMMQFHPTALDIGRDPMPLVSEAVRGEGAVLVDGSGARLVPGHDLAPRDVVARAVAAELARGGRVGLDTRAALGDDFAQHFPAIWSACRDAGVDPCAEPLPVTPAAHYHCGGVLVDLDGRASVPGLWAVGEVASTGLHGANRLASNSLLEAAVGGARVAGDLRRSGVGGPVLAPAGPARVARPSPAVTTRHTGGEAGTAPTWVRELMAAEVGIVRDGEGLARAVDRLRAEVDRDGIDAVADPTLVALLIAHSALRREESRGGHLRLDHPHPAARARHTVVSLAELASATSQHRRSA